MEKKGNGSLDANDVHYDLSQFSAVSRLILGFILQNGLGRSEFDVEHHVQAWSLQNSANSCLKTNT